VAPLPEKARLGTKPGGGVIGGFGGSKDTCDTSIACDAGFGEAGGANETWDGSMESCWSAMRA
jgi:hypothetical protein